MSAALPVVAVTDSDTQAPFDLGPVERQSLLQASLERARRRSHTHHSENRRSNHAYDRAMLEPAHPDAPRASEAKGYDYRKAPEYARGPSTRELTQRLDAEPYAGHAREQDRRPLDPVGAGVHVRRDYGARAGSDGHRTSAADAAQLQRGASRRRATQDVDAEMDLYKQRLAEIRAQR